MGQGEVPRGQAIAPQLDEGGGDDGKIRNADGNQNDQGDPQPRGDLPPGGQLGLRRAGALAADQAEAVFARDVVLQQPHGHADTHQNGGKTGRTAKIDGRGGGIAVNIGGEDIEPDAPPQGIGRSVFRQGLDEHQQRPDGIVAGEQRGKDLPQPQGKARAEDRAALLQAGGDVQHGIFQHAEGDLAIRVYVKELCSGILEHTAYPFRNAVHRQVGEVFAIKQYFAAQFACKELWDQAVDKPC